MFRMSDFKFSSVLSKLADFVTVSHRYNVYACSVDLNIWRLNLEKWCRILELVLALRVMAIIHPVYKSIQYFLSYTYFVLKLVVKNMIK